MAVDNRSAAAVDANAMPGPSCEYNICFIVIEKQDNPPSRPHQI